MKFKVYFKNERDESFVRTFDNIKSISNLFIEVNKVLNVDNNSFIQINGNTSIRRDQIIKWDYVEVKF